MALTYSKTQPILTLKQFKKKYLHGVDLRDGDGKALGNKEIEEFITDAIDWVEHELQFFLYKREITYYYDYMYANYRQFCFIEVDHYPINTVESVELVFSDTMKITFPEEWYKVYNNSGQIQLLPTASTLSSVIIAQSGQLLPRAIYTEYAPQLFKIVYSVGFDEDKVPPIINETIALKAVNEILIILGDVSPAGPGISSVSQSIDGMSQSTSTAISATNNLYGARILTNDKRLEKNLKTLKKRYKRFGFVVA